MDRIDKDEELMCPLLRKKRESTAEESSAVGDAAKLREALDESRRIASDLGGCRLNDYWKLNEIVRVCEAALAAPPRNCDVYDSYGDAIRAFEDDENAEEYEDVAEWLYAPATEGGAK